MIREGVIYKITNLINGKSYIGQSVDYKIRWSRHKREARGGQTTPLYNSIRKHGVENFSFEVIAETLQPFLNDLEMMYIKLYNSFSEYGYNLNEGGGCSLNSPETRAKIGTSGKGKHNKPHTSQAKINMSAAQKGRSKSVEHKAKLSAAHKGREQSEITIKKRSVKLKGRPSSKKGIKWSKPNPRKGVPLGSSIVTEAQIQETQAHKNTSRAKALKYLLYCARTGK